MSERIKKLNDLSIVGAYIAGGAVLSRITKTPIKDYDVYPKSKNSAIFIIENLMEDGCFIVNITDRAVTLKSNNIKDENGDRAIIQVMMFDVFESAEKIFQKFDFSVCMAAYDCDSGSYVFHPDFFPDVASKNLRFNHNTSFPLASFLRVKKYLEKGYQISKNEMSKIAIAISLKGVPTSWQEIENAIGGYYGQELRIASSDTPFSIEAVMEILSGDFNPENSMVDLSEKFSSLKSWEILDIYSNEEILYAEGNGDKNSFCYNSQEKCLRLDLEGKILYAFGEELLPFLKNAKQLTSGSIKDYKLLMAENGTLYSGVRGPKNGIAYEVGKEAIHEKSPYLYLFKNLEDAKNRKNTTNFGNRNAYKIYEASFDVSDLKFVSDMEIQVSKMFIEKEVV